MSVPMAQSALQFVAIEDPHWTMRFWPQAITTVAWGNAWAVKNLIWEEFFLCAKWFPFRRAGELCDGA